MTLTEVIISFTDWHQPWTFEAFVRLRLATKDEEREFDKIWNAALEFENWNAAELSDGIAKTESKLIKNFTLLPYVATQIARAASYQWK